MKTKAYAAVACAAVLVALAVAPAEAEPKTKASANPPRARIVVEPRSFLDAGTEVLPGERKFTDYGSAQRDLAEAVYQPNGLFRLGRSNGPGSGDRCQPTRPPVFVTTANGVEYGPGGKA
jgi:hypothetical protein